ncbi:MAG: ABC transporter permease [Rhodothermales bacterium]
MSDVRHRPPKGAAWLLGWLVRDAWQTPLGDFEEWFHEIAAERGVRYARWWYRHQVWRMLPDRLLAKTYWTFSMLKSYLILAYRNLLKNRVAAGINLVGLAVAIGVTLVAFVFIYSRTVRDTAHVNGESIVLVEQVQLEEGKTQFFGRAPVPLGPALANTSPHVLDAVRMTWGFGEVEHNSNVFGQGVTFVDPTFLNVFTFPLADGSVGALDDLNTLVLSAAMAVKYFGDAPAVGKELILTMSGQEAVVFTVGAVAEPFPMNVGLDFEVLLNIANATDRYEWFTADEWTREVTTFLHLADSDVAPEVMAQAATYLPQKHAAEQEEAVQRYQTTPLTEIGWRGDALNANPVGTPPWPPIVVLAVIAVFMLTLACLNYVNIALAAAARRLREIGMRKVMGGSRWQLIGQFLIENTLLCALALVAGVVLAAFLLVPAFAEISGSPLTLDLLAYPVLWVVLGVLLAAIALISGAYPALYVASFQPITIFRGRKTLGGRRLFSQVLLTVQFVLAFITMIISINFVTSARHFAVWDWGYENEQTLAVVTGEHQERLRTAAEALPGITAVAEAREHIGRNHNVLNSTIGGEELEVIAFDTSPNYAELMGLRLLAGQYPTEGLQHATDIVVNQVLASTQGWSPVEALGQAVRVDSSTYTIGAVVEDFHYYDFFSPIRPVMLRPGEQEAANYLVLKLQAGTATAVVEAMEAAWAEVAPSQTFSYVFQDEVFARFFEETRGIQKVFVFTALMALLLSCMGLFGLAAQNATSRMKEVGIRKSLGASLGHVTRLVNQRFIILLFVAAVVATPLCALLIGVLLDSIYRFHPGVMTLPFVVAYVIVFLVAALTISTQIYRIAVVNPAEVLRDE